jgi:CRP/FNR family cyclic AMP-dependent transcriptional regulator
MSFDASENLSRDGEGTAESVFAHEAPGVQELLMRPSLGARTLEVTAGRVLFDAETPAQHLFFIQSGQVRVYQPGPDGSTRLVEILGAGDWCGAAALAGETNHGNRAVAVTAAAVVDVRADRWLAVLAEHPALASQWIATLARKLQAARADAACLMFDDCNSRLVRALLHFSRSAAASPSEDGGVVLRITHQQLAQAVGAARETVSLALTQLRQRNLLRTGRNQLFFDPQVLETFSRGGSSANGNGHRERGEQLA